MGDRMNFFASIIHWALSAAWLESVHFIEWHSPSPVVTQASIKWVSCLCTCMISCLLEWLLKARRSMKQGPELAGFHFEHTWPPPDPSLSEMFNQIQFHQHFLTWDIFSFCNKSQSYCWIPVLYIWEWKGLSKELRVPWWLSESWSRWSFQSLGGPESSPDPGLRC